MDQAVAGFARLQALAGSFAPATCIAGLWLGFIVFPLCISGWHRYSSEERDRWQMAAIGIPFKLGILLLQLGQPLAGLPVLVSLILVICLAALTVRFFCMGRSFKDRGYETHL
jgi:hypothetical protein